MDNKGRERASLLPVRAMVAGLPVVMATVAFLWSTGYPEEEWAFIGGVLCLGLFGSGTLVGLSALFIAKWLDAYGRRLAGGWGIDLDSPDVSGSVPRKARFLIGGALVVLMLSAMWGLALNVLVLVMSGLEMVPLGAGLAGIAVALLCIGLCGLLLAFGVPAAVLYLADGHSRVLSWVLTRGRPGALNAVLGLEYVMPFNIRVGSSRIRLGR